MALGDMGRKLLSVVRFRHAETKPNAMNAPEPHGFQRTDGKQWWRPDWLDVFRRGIRTPFSG